jgi:L-rhamnose-H+ transport protein
MLASPILGTLFHATGGLAAASFYIPYKKVRGWSWETYWITGGVVSWLLMPPLMAVLILSAYYHVPLVQAITSSPANALLAAFGFGVLWGIGGLTFGLSMRYLGIGLGYAVALGFCAAFGQMIPPIVAGGYFEKLAHDRSTQIILLGVLTALLGIAFSGAAGISKENELSPEQKQKTTAEFNLWKGLLIATICGLLSACMSFAIQYGSGISDRAVALGTPALWAGLPLLIVAFLGGLLTNSVWCLVLLIKNRSYRQFIGHSSADGSKPPLLNNYALSALAGVTWYFQFFFYTMGAALLGAASAYSSWTLHMATIVIFATIWAIVLKEWKGTSRRTHLLMAAGLVILIVSTVIVGFGNFQNATSNP